MSKLKPIVHLRVYKGGRMAYDAAGNILNPNQSVKLAHDTIEWKNFLANLPVSGFTSVEVEKVLERTKDDKGKDVFKEIAISDELKNEVVAVFTKKEEDISPDQKRIAELEATVEMLKKANATKDAKATKDPKAPAVVDDAEMTALKAEYKSLSGKDAHRLVGKEKLTKDIAALKEKK